MLAIPGVHSLVALLLGLELGKFGLQFLHGVGVVAADCVVAGGVCGAAGIVGGFFSGLNGLAHIAVDFVQVAAVVALAVVADKDRLAGGNKPHDFVGGVAGGGAFGLGVGGAFFHAVDAGLLALLVVLTSD